MTLVFKNAQIFSAKAETGLEQSDCLVVDGDKIIYIGREGDEQIKAAQEQGAEVHDLNGKVLAPGFIDGHMHILLFGSSLLNIVLDHCQNLDDIRATIQAGARERPDARRLFCSGWMHSMTGSKALASMIDDLDPRPVFIYAKDLHSAWCNTAALKELGVQDMPDPEGGEIARDKSGNPSGLLSESAAIRIVWPHIANVTSHGEKLSFIREAVRAYSTAGYTGFVEMATEEENWALMQELQTEEDVPMRIAAHWLIKPSTTTEGNLTQVNRAIELHKQFNLDSSPDFRIAGIKVICDGVVDACTAALREPYSSTGTNCDPIWSAEMLRPVVEKADRAGLQCALHAIGDQAVKIAVDTIQAVGTPGRRHRIEHLELTSPEDSRRLGDLGITASVQPVHSDPSILRAWPTLVGDRCARAFAYKEFLVNHANVAFGTDSPTASHLPLPNLYTATTRRSAREPELINTFNKHFQFSLAEAMTAASASSAYSCLADKRVGTLEAGKLADFVVLDVQWAPETLLEASVLQTWFGGRCVFEK